MYEESKVPWWGAAGNAVWTLGPVTVAFFIVLGVGLGWFPSALLTSMSETNLLLGKNLVAILEVSRDLGVHSREFGAYQQNVLHSLRQICRNTAQTAVQNERCDEM